MPDALREVIALPFLSQPRASDQWERRPEFRVCSNSKSRRGGPKRLASLVVGQLEIAGLFNNEPDAQARANRCRK